MSPSKSRRSSFSVWRAWSHREGSRDGGSGEVLALRQGRAKPPGRGGKRGGAKCAAHLQVVPRGVGQLPRAPDDALHLPLQLLDLVLRSRRACRGRPLRLRLRNGLQYPRIHVHPDALVLRSLGLILRLHARGHPSRHPPRLIARAVSRLR